MLWGLTRAATGWSGLILMAPFALLTFAPMLLALMPLAFVGLPFIVFACFSGAAKNHFETRRLKAPQSALCTV